MEKGETAALITRGLEARANQNETQSASFNKALNPLTSPSAKCIQNVIPVPSDTCMDYILLT